MLDDIVVAGHARCLARPEEDNISGGNEPCYLAFWEYLIFLFPNPLSADRRGRVQKTGCRIMTRADWGQVRHCRSPFAAFREYGHCRYMLPGNLGRKLGERRGNSGTEIWGQTELP